MRLLEFFSGKKSVSKVAKTLGWETISLDIDPKSDPDLCMDILEFDQNQYPKDYFNFVWAGLAGIGGGVGLRAGRPLAVGRNVSQRPCGCIDGRDDSE